MGRKKLWRLFEEGSERLEKEFDLVKILLKLRNLNVFVKNKLIDEVTQVEINNCYKSVIAIDSDTPPESENDHSSNEVDPERTVEAKVKRGSRFNNILQPTYRNLTNNNIESNGLEFSDHFK